MAFEFVNQTVVSLFNSLSQLKDIGIYDFTFGQKKNKFENKKLGLQGKLTEFSLQSQRRTAQVKLFHGMK